MVSITIKAAESPRTLVVGVCQMECRCIDQDGEPAVIILPLEGECQHGDCCDDRETCEIMCAVGIDLGKVVEIRRPD